VDHLHSELDLRGGDVVEVEIDRPANVRLMDGPNFSAFHRGLGYRSWGGGYLAGVVRLAAPGYGHYHLVIDLGGNAGTIRHSIAVRRAA
jgi:hypothetical protein